MTISRCMGTGRSSSKLYSALKREILSGKMAGGDYLPTTRALCAKHELHMETVCRALRRLAQDGLVVGELRRGYRVQARANDPDRGCPLAVVLGGSPESWDPFEQRLLGALQQVATGQGRAVVAVGQGSRPAAAVVEELLSHRAWGVMLSAAEPELVGALKRAGLASVQVGSRHEGLELDSVVQDNFGGAVSAASHLAAQGHTRIGWLGYSLTETDIHAMERFCGAVGALARAGRELSPGLRVEVHIGDGGAALDAARRLFALPKSQRPTAVLALWQPLAAAAVRAAGEAGLAPGRDFDLVGWINEEAYESEYRPLFGAGPVAPAVTWSLSRMVEAALVRIEERRAKPGAASAQMRIPAKLRLADQEEKKEERK